MSNKRSAILELHRQEMRQCEIVRLLNVPRKLFPKQSSGSMNLAMKVIASGRGRKRTVNTPRIPQIIKKRVQRNSRLSMRKIARETGIGRETVRLIAKKELHIKPYKIPRAQLLTDENKKVRLERCRQILRRAANARWDKILFTDEKLCTIEQVHSRQNDRIWSAQAPGSSHIIEHRQNLKSVMVWAGICSSGKTPLIFVDQGVKINREVYRRNILEAVVLPWAQEHFGEQEWTFQQDSAPAHRTSEFKTGAKKIFRTLSQLQNGHRTH
ncbi:PREDICTED: uncharacterized protein LOC108368613 [Rhagoletis zephyria]|uniref:uncharacterized protein LOC108368613 n=1 Tax=Rhagoletis zephyria TaxID=28612 RepID=UPI0008115452|nr:PREDICTED: uncharacterized protein LOC108368613 [Rhagoletis zephyria]